MYENWEETAWPGLWAALEEGMPGAWERWEAEKGECIGVQACWEDLAQAIVVQGVLDYREIRMKQRRHRSWESLRKKASELEDFFRSPWYGCLMRTEGDDLFRLLQEKTAGEAPERAGRKIAPDFRKGGRAS